LGWACDVWESQREQGGKGGRAEICFVDSLESLDALNLVRIIRHIAINLVHMFRHIAINHRDDMASSIENKRTNSKSADERQSCLRSTLANIQETAGNIERDIDSIEGGRSDIDISGFDKGT